jgi:four helix bundle protein
MFRRYYVMEASKRFRDLLVWQKAHAFVLCTYRYTDKFPKAELYGLTSQFRRAAVSVAANIAEGFVKKSNADKLRYYNIAQGSLEECRYYIILSQDLMFAPTDNQMEIIAEQVSKLLYGFMSSIENSTSKKTHESDRIRDTD